jgi:hypothetical protein
MKTDNRQDCDQRAGIRGLPSLSELPATFCQMKCPAQQRLSKTSISFFREHI